MNRLTPLQLIKSRWPDLTSGDSGRVPRVINELRPDLQQICKSLIPDWLMAKADDSDIAQDTATRAISAFSQFKGNTPEAFWAWLVAIQRNEVRHLLERYRTARRELGREQPLDAGTEPADHRELGGELHWKESQATLEKALLTLKPDYQAVIRWRIYERRDLSEIAILMDREYEAVKKLFGRAIVDWKAACDRLDQF